MKNLKIGTVKIGNNCPAFIIAEISANHRQDFNIAQKTIEAAKAAGANAIKVQTYTPDTITFKSNSKYFRINQKTLWDGKTFYDLYNEAYMPWEWQPKLKKFSNKLGMEFFSSPFDHSAVDFLEKLNVPAYKIASYEITDIPLIEYAASKGKPMIISTGIATKTDIDLAIKSCIKKKNKKIILLKCTTAYPTPYSEVNLKSISYLIGKYHMIIGLSDHTLGIEIPIASIAIGAKVIEKHIILDKKLGGPDSAFSLTPSEFKKMTDSVRKVEQSLGNAKIYLSKLVKKNREFSRSIFAVKNIAKEEKFSNNNIKSIRPAFGIKPKHLSRIIGKKSLKNIVAGTPLKWTYIK